MTRTTARKLLLALAVLASPSLLGGCAVIRWFANPQPRVEYSVEDYAWPESIVGRSPVVYRPKLESSGEALGDRTDRRLLEAYAPVLVQGVQPEGKETYHALSDRIGTPQLLEHPERGYRVRVDTRRPRIYTRVDEATVRDRRLKQLVYAYWYPDHPVGGIQKGEVDGGVLRVTLDSEHRPAVYEHVQACGCYHGAFVADRVEAWAQLEFETPSSGRSRFTEKSLGDRIEWVVRDTVVGAHGMDRPVLLMEAGSHACLSVQTEALVLNLDQFRRQSYTLAPYEDLDQLEVTNGSGGRASMFDDEGLVWGGRRWGEEIVFPTMDHPGWPRHLDQVKIHWDEARLNDPTLLETYLRLPSRVLTPVVARTNDRRGGSTERRETLLE